MSIIVSNRYKNNKDKISNFSSIITKETENEKIINNFNLSSPDIIQIKEKKQLEYDLNEYSKKNNIKINLKMIKNKNLKYKNLFKDAIINDIINNNDKTYECYKENIKNEILNNNLKNIKKYYEYNPDRNKRKESDDDFILNQPLKSNGKTLIFIAVEEANFEILKYFIEIGLNPKINSKIDDNDFESPLEYACRWNYIKIIELLLSKIEFTKTEILFIYRKNKNYLSNEVIDILKSYLRNHPKSSEKAYCFC